jgi:hypothetical protein
VAAADRTDYETNLGGQVQEDPVGFCPESDVGAGGALTTLADLTLSCRHDRRCEAVS